VSVTVRNGWRWFSAGYPKEPTISSWLPPPFQTGRECSTVTHTILMQRNCQVLSDAVIDTTQNSSTITAETHQAIPNYFDF
jgi:hypothetical protein